MSVDGLDESQQSTFRDARGFLEQIEFPFASGQATRETLDKLEILQGIIMNRLPTMAVPMSFLIDGQGRLATIYRGETDIPTLLEDVHHLSADVRARRDLAVPFSGRWLGDPKQILLRALAGEFKEHGHDADYERYLSMDTEQMAARGHLAQSSEERRKIDLEYATSSFSLARQMQLEGRLETAIDLYSRGLSVLPDAARCAQLSRASVAGEGGRKRGREPLAGSDSRQP